MIYEALDVDSLLSDTINYCVSCFGLFYSIWSHIYMAELFSEQILANASFINF